MPIMTAIPLSASSGGRPIPIIAVTSPGTLLHTLAPAPGVVEDVYLDIYNTATADYAVTIEAGATATIGHLSVLIPAQSFARVLAGVRFLAATDTIRAFATATGFFEAMGGVNKATP